MAGIEALLASINPHVSRGEPLRRQVSHVIHVVAEVKPATAGLLRTTYEGLSGMFNRVQAQKPAVGLTAESVAVAEFKSLVFGPVVSVEAVRLVRAEAIVAAAKASAAMAEGMAMEVRALIANEVSSVVRDRLEAALVAP